MNQKKDMNILVVAVINLMKQIYFDNAATTKVDERVLKKMLPFFDEFYANCHAVHTQGQVALEAVEEARESIARNLEVDSQEVIFTSGATESNNISIRGVVEKFIKDNKKIHIITSSIEHPSVLEIFKYYQKNDLVEVSFIPVNEQGVVKLDKLESLIRDNTVLISVMYVNNEIGTIQPIEKIASMIKDKDIILHVDAVQAFNYINCSPNLLNCDLMSFSGHKIHGPKGIGVLYVKAGTKLDPIQHGGHQEFNIRSGTLNVPGIVAIAEAVNVVYAEREKNIKKTKGVKDELIRELNKINDIKLNGAEQNQIPSLINVSFLKAEGESILMMLDMDGIAISTGSACSSGSLEPSHVLTAIGRKPEWTHGSIRISLGKFNNLTEVPVFMKSVITIIKKLREMAP